MDETTLRALYGNSKEINEFLRSVDELMAEENGYEGDGVTSKFQGIAGGRINQGDPVFINEFGRVCTVAYREPIMKPDEEHTVLVRINPDGTYVALEDSVPVPIRGDHSA